MKFGHNYYNRETRRCKEIQKTYLTTEKKKKKRALEYISLFV